MSHSIQAFIAHEAVISKICKEWPDAVQLPLNKSSIEASHAGHRVSMAVPKMVTLRAGDAHELHVQPT